MKRTENILVSENLKSLFRKISNNSWIAEELLKDSIDKDKLKEDFINYLSISKKDNNKLSYLTKDRIDKIEKLGIDPWTYNGRYKARIGSFINKIFKDVSGPDIENFSNLMKAVIKQDSLNWGLVSGNNIKYYYDYKRHAHMDRGPLGISCMRHEQCSYYFDVYTKNEDIINMLILFDDDNKVLGRALLWNIGDFKFMDRIYTAYQEDEFYFKKWADDNDYAYKKDQSWRSPYIFQKGKEIFQKKICLNIKNWDFEYYPYMDTFKWLDMDKGNFYNWLPTYDECNSNNLVTLINIQGSYSNRDCLDLDEVHNEYGWREEIRFCNYIKKRVFSNYLVWSNICNDNILTSDSIYCEDINDYIFGEKYDNLNPKEDIEKKIEEIRKIREEKEKNLKEYSSKAKIKFEEYITTWVSGNYQINDITTTNIEQNIIDGISNYVSDDVLVRLSEPSVIDTENDISDYTNEPFIQSDG